MPKYSIRLFVSSVVPLGYPLFYLWSASIKLIEKIEKFLTQRNAQFSDDWVSKFSIVLRTLR